MILTNIPAPYRVPVYAALTDDPGISLHVVFCSAREPDRDWDLTRFDFEHSYLEERFTRVAGRYIHHNRGVWRALSALAPDALVTTGFNPSHLVAFAWARWHRTPHLAMTDGTADSERSLTWLHRALRRHVYRRSHAFIGASDGSLALYRGYGVPEHAMFKSHLCADNDRYAGVRAERDVDLLFCSRIAAGKNPLFALEVAAEAARRMRRRLRMRVVGSGPLLESMKAAAAPLAENLDLEFAGFARQAQLPGHYAAAKLLLFPTAGDTWGVVANEACAAGTPVITSPRAGVAGELVRDGDTGRVLPLQRDLWADAAATLLLDHATRDAMSERARAAVQPYRFEHAAAGIAAAVRHACRPSHAPAPAALEEA